MSRTVVIGGGLAGLTAAHLLKARGEDVIVLEAGKRAGGACRTETREGFLLEQGPNSFVDRDPGFGALIDDLGLRSEVVHSSPDAKARYVVRRGALEPIPSKPPEMLRTPLLSWRGKARLLAEPLLARRAEASDETLEEFGLRHLGREATERLLDAMQTGIYAGRIDELSAQSTFPQLVEMERDARSLLLGAIRSRKNGSSQPRGQISSFAGGMGRLSEALAAKLGDSLKLEHAVEGLERSGSGWKVHLEGDWMPAERVILATPPGATAAILRELDAPLAAALNAIPNAPMVVVHLGMPRERVDHKLDGFGFLVPAVENRQVLGCIFSSALFPKRAPEGQALLTVLIGGRRHPELVDLDDRAIIARVRDELRALAVTDAEPELVNVIRHPSGIPQYAVGHRARLETIEHRIQQLPGLALTGWGYRGVGVLDVVREARALVERLPAMAGAA